MFKEKKINNSIVYYSDIIPDLEHFFTTRQINVDRNKDKICDYLKISVKNLINPTQTHSDNISFAQEGQDKYPDTDALILTNKHQAIYMRFADCTPVIIYNKEANIAAVVHAGWRGTAKQISVKTLMTMQNYTKTSLASFYAVIGPAIGKCCYQVGDDVIHQISSTLKDTQGLILENKHIDLKGINAKQLIEYGIPNENIDICPYCTSCNNDLFFSYRKENGTPERHNAVIKLK